MAGLPSDPRSSETLERLLSRALEEDDLREHSDEHDDLRAAVLDAISSDDTVRNAVWEAGTRELRLLIEAARDLEPLEAVLHPRSVPPARVFEAVPMRIPVAVFLFGVFLLTAVYTPINPDYFGITDSSKIPSTVLGGLLICAAIGGYIFRWWAQISRRAADLQKRMQILHRAFDEAVLRGGLLPVIRQNLNALLERSGRNRYGTVFTVTGPTGLRDAPDLSAPVETEAWWKVRAFLSDVRGGSIGISGPRGVGKTTLISSFCDRPASSGDAAVRVLISAPVDYSPHEFVLLLLWKVCQTLIPADRLGDAGWRRPAIAGRGVPAISESGLPIWLGGLSVAVGTAIVYVKLTPVDPRFLWAVAATLLIAGPLLWLSGVAVRTLARPSRDRAGGESPLDERVKEISELIRYQRAYSADWTGGLDLPYGLKVGRSSGRTLSENALTYPQLVEQFRELIELAASERGNVVIGIDEIDKIGSDEAAQRFLNDIKAIFGIPGCFYLVSVSEDAISHFERRGLPIRDAFDSAFTTIIRVPYLDLNGSRTLLERHLIGIPRPFVYLCHALSGGLPRDLVRYARDLVPPHEGSMSIGLSEACKGVVTRDLSGKVEATWAEMSRLGVAQRTWPLILGFGHGRSPGVSPQELLDRAVSLVSERQFVTAAYPADSMDERETRAAALAAQLAGYHFLCATLVELFADSLTEVTLRRAETPDDSGSLERLADARRAFGVSIAQAWSLIAEFRLAWKMIRADAKVVLPWDSPGPWTNSSDLKKPTRRVIHHRRSREMPA